MMRALSILSRCAPAAAALMAGCTHDAPPPVTPGPQTNTAQAPAPQQSGRSDPACVAPFDASSKLTLRQAKGELKLGVLAGLKDSEDDNVKQARALADELKRRGAELLVAAGDVGDTVEAQLSLLGALTATGLPLFVLPGNREVRSDLDGVVTELRRRGNTVIDLSRTRAADLGDAVLVSLPGTFEKKQLRADGACVYVQADLDALASFLDKRPAIAPPALLVAAVPPRGNGQQALDVTEGQNVGDPRLLALLSPQRAPFGIFGQVWEAGGRGIDGEQKAVAQGTGSTQLYVNPGAADSTAWPMSDGSTSHGLAALMTIHGRNASYEVVRAPAAAEARK